MLKQATLVAVGKEDLGLWSSMKLCDPAVSTSSMRAEHQQEPLPMMMKGGRKDKEAIVEIEDENHNCYEI
jgi:hypothetical protein